MSVLPQPTEDAQSQALCDAVSVSLHISHDVILPPRSPAPCVADLLSEGVAPGCLVVSHIQVSAPGMNSASKLHTSLSAPSPLVRVCIAHVEWLQQLPTLKRTTACGMLAFFKHVPPSLLLLSFITSVGIVQTAGYFVVVCSSAVVLLRSSWPWGCSSLDTNAGRWQPMCIALI